MDDSIEIVPIKHITQIKIDMVDYPAFKKMWKSQKVLDFYCTGKQVFGDYVILDIRSMRINEFTQMLKDNNVKWELV